MAVYKCFFLLWLLLLPSAVMLYAVTTPTPAFFFQIHSVHILGVLLADILAIFVAYATYRGSIQRKSLFLAYATISYAGFALLYTFYSFAIFTSDQSLSVFLLFAPMARIVLSLYLFFGLAHLQNRTSNDSFSWKAHGSTLLLLTALLLSTTQFITSLPAALMQLFEGIALVASLIVCAKMFFLLKKTAMLIYHLLAQFIFTQSSAAFLIGTPWNAVWWIGQILIITGFMVLGFAIIHLYEKTHSFDRIYDSTVLEHLVDQIIDSSPVGILLVDSSFHLVRSNSTSDHLLDWAQPDHNIEELIKSLKIDSTLLETYLHETSCVFSSLTKETPDGEKALDAKICKLEDPLSDGYLITLIDMTAHHKAQQKINYLAKYDTLTNLPNRTEFLEKLDQELDAVRHTDKLLAVMFLDLDGFKQINDTLGHSFGDLVLKVIATRLRQSFKQTDTIARLGGDEFTAIVPGVASWLDVGSIAERILIALEKPVVINGHSFFLSASIGISLYPIHGKTTTELITQADTAMYQIKKHGKNGYIFADSTKPI